MKIKHLTAIFLATALWCVGCVPTIDDISTFGGIYGYVSDAKTGAPIAAAEVVLSPGNASTVTGASGHFEFTDLEVKQYRIQLSATGYLSTGRQISVIAGQTVSADIAMTPEVESSTIKLSTSALNFNNSYNVLSFSIQNIGTSGTLDWNITNIENWFSVNPTSGQVEMGKSSSVVVTVDLSKVSNDVHTQIIVNVNNEMLPIAINYQAQGSGGEGGGGNEGGGGGGGVNVTNGLYAYYTFESNTKNTVDGAPNATPVNAPTYAEGMKGSKAIKFSVADDSYISVPDPMIDGGTFTVSFWIKGLSDGHIFHVNTPDANYLTQFICLMKNGFMAYATSGYTIWSRPDELVNYTHPTIDSSQWHHIVISSKKEYSNATTKLYIDGEFVDTLVETNIYFGKGSKFIMGGKLVTITPPSMTVDNLRVYNSRELTAREVQQIYDYER